MPLRIAFGVQSAVHRADTLQQLIATLGRHAVVIHHDFSQQPQFNATGPNVHFVENPARTGWANWGLIEAIEKTVEHCVRHLDFDYFQLLSPVDLPVRPLAEFEEFIAQSRCDFHADALALDVDELAFLTFAYRAYAVDGSWQARAMRRLWLKCFGSDPQTETRSGLAVPTGLRRGPDGRLRRSAQLASRATHQIVDWLRHRDPLLARYPVHVGSMWFGASARGCEYLLAQLRDPGFVSRFRHYFCAGEMLFNTAIVMSGMPYANGNHALSRFEGARPAWLGIDDLDSLCGTGKFFARKFPDDPLAPVRIGLLERIGASSDSGERLPVAPEPPLLRLDPRRPSVEESLPAGAARGAAPALRSAPVLPLDATLRPSSAGAHPAAWRRAGGLMSVN